MTAFGGSAFINANHFSPSIGGRSISAPVLAQTQSNGSYTQEDGTGSCLNNTNSYCSYSVIQPNGIPDRGSLGTYSLSEIIFIFR